MMTNQEERFAQRLITHRLKTGMSLRQLGAHLGVAFSTLARIERGVGHPDRHTRMLIEQWIDPQTTQDCACVKCQRSFVRSAAVHQLLLPHGMTITMLDDVGTVSDGYHTFNELYQHRHLLFCLLIREDYEAWKSRCHADGQPTPSGWFIAGTTLLCAYEETDNGTPSSRYSLCKDITYHLPNEMWDLCQVKELPKAPAWDGHSSLDVLDRLTRCLDGTIRGKH